MEKDIISLGKQFLPESALPPRVPVVFVEGKGATLISAHGEEYLDLFSGIAVTNAGHCHPRLVKAGTDQLKKVWHVSNLYYNEPATLLAKELANITGLEVTFFCNSGAESVEGAVKLAKRYAVAQGDTGTEIIALQGSFHGRTSLTLGLTGQKKYKEKMGPFVHSSGITHVPTPYCYRCPHSYPDCGIICAYALQDALTYQTTGDVAAFIAEPILGEGGIIVPPKEYFTITQRICKEQGILFIADEVQTGFGRTGSMFASQEMGIQPDIMTMAKGIAGGLPLGAFSSSKELFSAFSPGDHFSTFGGNPVCCAVAREIITVLQEEGLIEHARTLGTYIMKRCMEIQQESELIGEVRGLGLMIGIELLSPEIAQKLHAFMIKNNCIVGLGGLHKTVIRMQPPLVIKKEEADHALSVFEKGLSEI
jgi:4-aminobutyrate aminotransferase-like enzyme